ncbi:hypothetical protein SAMN06298216_1716 [Spirosomataceae bacterium TFI 002]|nr:hypothetical protein SAMN06298216_1716 [Spirosomataceae bacterium TFI 002]
MTHNFTFRKRLLAASRISIAFLLTFVSFLLPKAKAFIDNDTLNHTNSNLLIFNEDGDAEIKWIEDDGAVDCITYTLTSNKDSYETGEEVIITATLRYINNLPLSWKDEDCQNLALKVILGNGFVKTGGDYFDYMTVKFDEFNLTREIKIKGYFKDANDRSCFLLLKGPKFSNAETTFIKKDQLCLKSLGESRLNSFGREAIGSIITIGSKDKLPSILEAKATTGTPIKVATSEFDCTTTECDEITICQGESTVLFSEGCENGEVSWSTGRSGVNALVAPEFTTVYTAECIEDGVVTSSDNATITVSTATSPNIPLTITGPFEVCAGGGVTLTASGCPNGQTYSFVARNIDNGNVIAFPDNNFPLNTSQNDFGTYYVTAKCVDPNGCNSMESGLYEVDVQQPGIINQVDFIGLGLSSSAIGTQSNYAGLFCINEMATLTVEGCNGEITWSDFPNNTGFEIENNTIDFTFSNQAQVVNYTCNQGGCIRTGSFTLPAGTSQMAKPELKLSYESEVEVKAAQYGTSNTLMLTASNCERNFLWWDNQITTDPIRTVILDPTFETTVYTVQCAGVNGDCASEAADVTLYNLSIANSETELCFGSSINLVLNGCDNNAIVRWFKEGELAPIGSGNSFEFTNNVVAGENVSYSAECISLYLNSDGNEYLRFNSEIKAIILKPSLETPTINASGTANYDQGSGTVTMFANTILASLQSTGCTTTMWFSSLNPNQELTPYSSSTNGDIFNIFIEEEQTIYAKCVQQEDCPAVFSNVISFVRCSSENPILVLSQNTTSACDQITATITGCESTSGARLEEIELASGQRVATYSASYANGVHFIGGIETLASSTYRAQCFNNSTGCTSGYSNEENTTVTPTIGQVTISNNRRTVCQADTYTFQASGCQSGEILWSTHPSFFEILGTGSSFTTPSLTLTAGTSVVEEKAYWTACRVGDCIGRAAPAVVKVVRNKPLSPTHNYSSVINVCGAQLITVSASCPTGAVKWSQTGRFGSKYGNTNYFTFTEDKQIFASCVSNYQIVNGEYIGCESELSLPIIINHSSVIPEKVIASTSKTSICQGEFATITASNCSGSLTWNWTNTNGQSGSFSSQEVNEQIQYNTTYTANCTNSCGTSTEASDPITIQVSQGLNYTATIAANNLTVCQGELAELTASGCESETIWYISSLSNGETTVTSSQISQVILENTTYKAKCSNTCGISNDFSNTITISVLLSPTTPSINYRTSSDVTRLTTDFNLVSQSVSLIFYASNCNGVVRWSDGRTGSSINLTVVDPTTVYARCESTNGCSSPASNLVNITRCNTDQITVAVSNFTPQACEQFTISASGCSAGSTYFLSRNGSASPSSLGIWNISSSTNGGIYSVYCRNQSYCFTKSYGINGISIQNEIEKPIVANNLLTVCNGSSANLSASNCEGGVIKWYRFSTFLGSGENYNTGALIHTSSNLSPQVFDYEVTCTKNGCESLRELVRVAVPKTVEPYELVSNTTEVCNSSLVTFSPIIVGSKTSRDFIEWNINGIYETPIATTTNSSRSIQISDETTVSATHIYRFWSAENTGCATQPSNEITVKVVTALPEKVIVNANTTLVCPTDNETVILSATNCEGDVNWQWSNTNGQSGVLTAETIEEILLHTTTYQAKCQNACGESAAWSDPVIITVTDPAPPVIAVSNEVVCNTISSRAPITFTATGCNGGIITWSDGTIGNTFDKVIAEPVSYTATCTIGSCVSENSNILQISVLDPPLPVQITAIGMPDLAICEGDLTPIALEADGCNGTLLWSTNETTNTISVSPITTTTYTATCSNACGDTPSSITISVEAIPATPVIVSSENALCLGETATLTVPGCTGTVLWEKDGTFQNINPFEVSPQATSIYNAKCTSATGKCTSLVGSLEITVVDPVIPVIVASKNLICEGETLELTATACTNAITWYENDLPLTETSSTLLASPLVDATYKVICISSDCTIPQESIATAIQVRPPPAQPNIVLSPASICVGESALLTTSSCTGTILWSTGESTNTITVNPSTTTTYSVSCTTECQSASSSAEIVVEAIPVEPNLVADNENICLGQSTTISIDNCGGKVVWADIASNEITRTLSPTTSTTYSATCESLSGTCVSSSANVTIAVSEIVAPVLTADESTICENEPLTLSVTGCNGLITWSTGQTSNAVNGIGTLTINPSITALYSAICEGTACSQTTQSNEISVAVNPLPSQPLIVSSAVTICNGESITLEAQNCNGVILWSSGETTASIQASPIENTTFTVSCSNDCGTVEAEPIVISVNAVVSPVLSASVSLVCPGEEVSITATGCSDQIAWSGPNGFSATTAIVTVNPTETTSYQAICSSQGCNSLPATIEIAAKVLDTKPVITTNTGITAVCKETSITLTASGCETGNLVWSTGETGVRSITSAPDKRALGEIFPYSVSCVTECGSIDSDVLDIIVTKPLQPVLEPEYQEVCVGSTFSLNVSTACANGYLQWRNEDFPDFEGNPTLVAEEAGTTRYRVRCVIGACNSPYSETVAVVKAFDIPEVSITHNSPVREGKRLIFKSTNTAQSYAWSGPNGFTSEIKNNSIQNAAFVNEGIYTLTATNGSSCSATATANVVVIPNGDIIVTSNSPLCAGEELQLNAYGGRSYQWTGPNGFSSTDESPVFTNSNPSLTGIYTVVVNITNSISNTGTVLITVNPKPAGFMETQQVACTGQSFQFTAPGANSYRWVGPNEFNSSIQKPVIENITAAAGGVYSLWVTSGQGCESIGAVFMTVNQGASLSISSNSPIDIDGTLNLQATGDGPFSWTGPNNFVSTDQNPSISNATLANAGKYIVSVSGANGCVATKEVYAIVGSVEENCDGYQLAAYNQANELVEALTRDASTQAYEAVTLQLDGPPLPAEFTYSWLKNGVELETTPTLSVNDVGTYELSVGNELVSCYYDIALSGSPCLPLEASSELQCSTAFDFPAQSDNELEQLKVGDTFIAADYTFKVTEITSSGADGFTGLGIGSIRLINGIDIDILPIEFKNIALNSCYQYIGVSRLPSNEDEFVGIRTQYDPEWSNILDVGKIYKNINELFSDLEKDLDDAIGVFEAQSDEEILEYILKNKNDCERYAQAVRDLEDYPEPAKQELIEEINKVCAAYDEFFVCKSPAQTNPNGRQANLRMGTEDPCTITSEQTAVKVIASKEKVNQLINDKLYVFYAEDWTPFVFKAPKGNVEWFYNKKLTQPAGTHPGIFLRIVNNIGEANAFTYSYNLISKRFERDNGSEKVDINSDFKEKVVDFDIDHSKIQWGRIIQMRDCNEGSFRYWITHTNLDAWKTTSNFDSDLLHDPTFLKDLTCGSIINLTGEPLDLEDLDPLLSGKKKEAEGNHSSNIRLYVTTSSFLRDNVEWLARLEKITGSNEGIAWINRLDNGDWEFRGGLEKQTSEFDDFFANSGVSFAIIKNQFKGLQSLSTSLYELFDWTSKGLEKAKIPEYAWNCNHPSYDKKYSDFFKLVTYPIQAVQTYACEKVIGVVNNAFPKGSGVTTAFNCNDLGNYQLAEIAGLWNGFVDIFSSASKLLQQVGGLASDAQWAEWDNLYTGLVNYRRVENANTPQEEVVSFGWSGALKDGLGDFFDPNKPCQLIHNVSSIAAPIAISFVAGPAFLASGGPISDAALVIRKIAKVVTKIDDFTGLPGSVAGKFVSKGVFRVFETSGAKGILYEIRDGIFKGKIKKLNGDIVDAKTLDGKPLEVDDFEVRKSAGCNSVSGFADFGPGNSTSRLIYFADCNLELFDKDGNKLGVITNFIDILDDLATRANLDISAKNSLKLDLGKSIDFEDYINDLYKLDPTDAANKVKAWDKVKHSLDAGIAAKATDVPFLQKFDDIVQNNNLGLDADGLQGVLNAAANKSQLWDEPGKILDAVKRASDGNISGMVVAHKKFPVAANGNSGGFLVPAKQYQKAASGDANLSFEVGGRSFDNIAPDGKLIDRKFGHSNSIFDRVQNEFGEVDLVVHNPTRVKSLLTQAKGQLDAANGHPIRWEISTTTGADGIQSIFNGNFPQFLDDFPGVDFSVIEVIHVPL